MTATGDSTVSIRTKSVWLAITSSMFLYAPAASSEAFFEDVIGVTKHERLTKAAVRFVADNRQASYILTKPLHDSQTLVEQCSDGSMVFEITVVLNPELYTLLMGFGPGVKVLSPEKVVKEMKKLYREGSRNYGML